MDDNAALLRSILDAPDDDAPRLVYADWLEESGDPDQTLRAQFIRHQISLRTANPAASAEALDEQRRLLDLAERRWVPDWLRGNRASWGRGFIQEVACSMSDWARHGQELLAEHPIRRVVLHGEVLREHVPVLEQTKTPWRNLDLTQCTFAPSIHLAVAAGATSVVARHVLQGMYPVGRVWQRVWHPWRGG
jgi:uncharacterized protein (TIGR02996 family)